jgi:exonuclease III
MVEPKFVVTLLNAIARMNKSLVSKFWLLVSHITLKNLFSKIVRQLKEITFKVIISKLTLRLGKIIFKVLPSRVTSCFRNVESNNPLITEEKVNQFGYHTRNLEDICDSFEEEYTIRLSNTEKIPSVFKVLTWNIWGMNKRHNKEKEKAKEKGNGEKYILINELMVLRMKKVVKIINEKDPDVILLQEMTYESLGIFKGFMRLFGLTKKYKEYCYNFYQYGPDTLEQKINRDMETYVLSKYTPNTISQYTIPGNLGYSTGAVVISFDNLNIVGCHLQAGSKYSPGQEAYHHYYSKCRSQQLSAINSIIEKFCPNKTVILCGDFNMDLDGDIDEWPETEEVKKLKMTDSWRNIYNDKEEHPGFTEDTKINHMRWNIKFIEKQFRYDAILFKNVCTNIIPIETTLVGTKGYILDDVFFEEFSRIMSSKKTTSDYKLRSTSYHPSDHFGVMTTFAISC